jgi:hypothetical protein
MKKLIYILATILLYNSCSQDKPVVAPPKTYPDLSGQWVFYYPRCDGFDTTNGIIKPLFTSGKDDQGSFTIDRVDEINMKYIVSGFYSEKNNVSGTYFKIRQTEISHNDTLKLTIFETLRGDSIGTFSGKFNPLNRKLEGYFDTWYNMYCFCRFAGVDVPFRHKVTTL